MDLTFDHSAINLPAGEDVAGIHHQPGMGGDEAVVDAGMVGGNEHCIVGGQILRGQWRGFHFEVMAPGTTHHRNDIPIKKSIRRK